jgi:hypothetical protein
MAPHEIVLFLQLVRDARAAGRLTYRRSRGKNLDTLLELGWLPRDMFDHVATLRPEQALGVPWDSRHPDHPEEKACEFGTRADGRDVYVKVTVVGLDDGIAGCVVSFHFAERPFVFPFGG